MRLLLTTLWGWSLLPACLALPELRPELHLRSGASFVTLSSPLLPEPGTATGFSFRSCLASGELLRQIGDSTDSASLGFTAAGGLVLRLQAGEEVRESVLEGNLADGAWHTVRVSVAPGGAALCLSVDAPAGSLEAECPAPRSGPSVVAAASSQAPVARVEGVEALLGRLNLTGGDLRLGGGLVACLREGPGVRTTTGLVTGEVGVAWGPCLLPHTCQGTDWAALSSTDSSELCPLRCQSGGLCLPRVPSASAPASAACSCPPGYGGRTCTLPSTSCAESPCLHGANCTDSPGSGAGYVCDCDGTGHAGAYCENELNHCSSTAPPCGAGECLPQPGGFLCSCGPELGGSTCSTRREPGGREGSRNLVQEQPMAGEQDPCLSPATNPCQHGGKCIYAGGRATCDCPAAYSGVHCQEEADPCDATTCPENSVCSSGGGAPQCTCSPGYSGTPDTGCSKIDWCSEIPCTHGTCMDGTTTYSCMCEDGWQGATCEEDVLECSTSPCQNGGSCTELAGSYSCSCAAGWTGDNCKSDVDECAGSPCQHGTCANMRGTYRCTCDQGWDGRDCDINIDECLMEGESRCANNGTCVDGINSFSCDCLPGYSGETCQTDINECLVSPPPCLNNGTCVDLVNSFSCSCTPRYMGPTCAELYDPCTSTPCLNGANCNQESEERGSGRDYSCTCPPGFQGPDCEENIDDCAGVTCEQGKQCVDLVQAHECRCPPGLTGDTCLLEVDECAPRPCTNGGVCSNVEGAGFECACPAGWTGSTCMEDVDECEEDDNICNWGICRNLNGSFECFCRPGYSGSRCNHEFDECLSNPCQHGNCTNLVNEYKCVCLEGFSGDNCETDIDECASSPCLNGATCIDGVGGLNNYTCTCLPGYQGRTCQVDIDDCEGNPCINGGTCEDGVNMFTCNCSGTGYTGGTCSVDIDECEALPCQHDSTCSNLVNDYSCECFAGFTGKECEQDIPECDDNPCQNNASCYERSNITLYQPPVLTTLPTEVQAVFSKNFSYAEASGYLCDCLNGFEGSECQVDINECESQPCKNGAECEDGIAEYTCKCKPGFEGDQCQVDIDECELLSPCQNGAVCLDRVDDYFCRCEAGFGGKNCSVPLTGCTDHTCLNGGTCTPYLVGETDHRFNCSCVNGFDGERCQLTTTMSFKGDSFVSVKTDRQEGFELFFRFRTTLTNGLLAIGNGESFFTLQLNQGSLNLHSSMLNQFEGISIGEDLANTEWQKVYISVNFTHLTIGLNSLQRTDPINPDNVNQTAFQTTWLGGGDRQSMSLVRVDPAAGNVAGKMFVGCIQDISVNGQKVREDAFLVEGQEVENLTIQQQNTEKGCARRDQCNPNPCMNDGVCTDLWRNYSCECHRPYLGSSCQYEYSSATFGHENITNSAVVVDIDNPSAFREEIELSMFIRTRQASGLIFYLGKSDFSSPNKNHLRGILANGTLQVEAAFGVETPEMFKLYSVQLDDGNRHFLKVIRMKNKMIVEVNSTRGDQPIAINQEVSSIVPIQAEKLYLGNLASLPDPTTEAPETTTTTTTTTTTQLPPAAAPLPSSSSPPVTSPSPSTSPSAPTAAFSAMETMLPEAVTEVPEDLATAATAPIVSRQRREDGEDEPGTTFFKGVIMDIRLSNRKGVDRIVELFPIPFAEGEGLDVEPSLGTVTAHDIEEGMVSDNSCRARPCQNGGECEVTWNDYQCKCKAGYKGGDCEELEYCYWNQCPANSTCRSLSDGHECITNATFDGSTTQLSYTAVLGDPNGLTNSLSAIFRSQAGGPILSLSSGGVQLKLSLVGGQVEVQLPDEDEEDAKFIFGEGLDDGNWHTVVIRPSAGLIIGEVDNKQIDDDILEENSTMNSLAEFVGQATVVVGSDGLGQEPDYFRGCMSEVRVGGVLLPFFTEEELVNSTAVKKFVVQERPEDLGMGDCVLCYQTECQHGGMCSDPSSEFQCSCQPGFSGPLCETNLDECVDSMCQNGACIDGISNYTCSCQPGWTGWLCDEDLDECAESPCMNGGSCSQTLAPGDYTCNCLDEYKGKDCQELKVKTCRELPCVNGGTCIDEQLQGPEKYRCDCPSGYEGRNCENEIDFCVKLNVVCQNGGTCKSDFASFNGNCECLTGYEGVKCEINIDDCKNNPCQNNGKCTDLINGYRCYCNDTGFTGDHCEQNINECLTVDKCKHGSNCTDTQGSFTCSCIGEARGYCGKQCQVPDPCSDPTVCMNEGLCIRACDSDPPYRCTCGEGWEGPTCNLKVYVGPRGTPRQQEENLLVYVVAPVAGGMIFVALVGLLVFLNMARRKRSQAGTYNPQKQELAGHRLELDYMLKLPAEERLI